MIPGHVLDMKGSGNNFYYSNDLNYQGPSTSGWNFDDFKNLDCDIIRLRPCVTRLVSFIQIDQIDCTFNFEETPLSPTPKNSAFIPQEHQIRKRFDERNKGIHRSAHSRGDGGSVEGLQSWCLRKEGLTTGIIRYGPELTLTWEKAS